MNKKAEPPAILLLPELILTSAVTLTFYQIGTLSKLPEKPTKLICLALLLIVDEVHVIIVSL